MLILHQNVVIHLTHVYHWGFELMCTIFVFYSIAMLCLSNIILIHHVFSLFYSLNAVTFLQLSLNCDKNVSVLFIFFFFLYAYTLNIQDEILWHSGWIYHFFPRT